jgi:hypothetical protein
VSGTVVVVCPECGATVARIADAGDVLQISARGDFGIADRGPDPGTPARTIREWMADEEAVRKWLDDDRDHVVTGPVEAQLPAGPMHHVVNFRCRNAVCVPDLCLCTCQFRRVAPMPGQRPSRWTPTADEVRAARACLVAGAALTELRGAVPIVVTSGRNLDGWRREAAGRLVDGSPAWWPGLPGLVADWYTAQPGRAVSLPEQRT